MAKQFIIDFGEICALPGIRLTRVLWIQGYEDNFAKSIISDGRY